MKKFCYLFPLILLSLNACKYFSHDENEINIPENVTEEQLQAQRYKYKRDNAYKQQFVQQEKTESAIITLFNVIPYQIKDEAATNIGEGFTYYIIDLGVDNFTDKPFNIGTFTKSCHLTT